MFSNDLPLFKRGGELRDEMEAIIEAVRAGDISGDFNRIAINVQFIAPQTGTKEANKAITGVLPQQYHVNLDEEEGFILQINLPYTSTSPEGQRMNAITKWSVDRIQVLTFQLPVIPTQVVVPGKPVAATPTTKEFVTASVSFEHNNASANERVTSAIGLLLGDALERISESQREIGLHIEAF